MKKQKLPKAFVKAIEQVTNKRARIVLDHISQHGFITSEELTGQYGYQHPPRAARDVRELGFPVDTFSVKSKDGRNIAAYRFGDVKSFGGSISSARRMLPKAFKGKLIAEFGSKCNICSGKFESRYLQVDHRVPFAVHGEVEEELDLKDFQLLCGSCNRAKSWSCEHCGNLLKIKDSGVCVTCYWGNSEDYMHVAMEDTRRLDLLWQGKEIEDFDRAKDNAVAKGLEFPDFVKQIIQARNRLNF